MELLTEQGCAVPGNAVSDSYEQEQFLIRCSAEQALQMLMLLWSAD